MVSTGAGLQVWAERLPMAALLVGNRVTLELWEVSASNDSALRHKAGGGLGASLDVSGQSI